MLNPYIQRLLREEMTRKEFLSFSVLSVIALFGIVGSITEFTSHAATPTASEEAEDGIISGSASTVLDGTASGGKAVEFGADTLSNIFGFTLPGYTGASAWAPGMTNHSQAMALPAQVTAVGANWVALQTTYTTADWSGTDVTVGAGTVSDAGIGAMIAAAKTAGLKICLKPHCEPADGTAQSYHMPGAQFSCLSYGNTQSTGTYTPNSTVISASGSLLNLTSTNTGDRVVSLTYSSGHDIPNSLYANPYATGVDPANATVGTVTASQSFSLADSSGTAITPTAYSTSGFFAVIHDTTAATWFSNWQAVILHLLDIGAQKGGVDAINLATEHDLCTRNYPNQWRNLIASVRAKYPDVALFVQASEGLSYGGDCGFIDKLDAIGVSAYPTVGTTAGDDTQATVTANWANAVNTIGAGYYAAWNKPVIFGEVGARSITGAGYEPYQSSGGTAQYPATDQAAFITGMLSTCWGKPWFGGFYWWTWFSALNSQTYPFDDPTSYAPKSPSEDVFSSWDH